MERLQQQMEPSAVGTEMTHIFKSNQTDIIRPFENIAIRYGTTKLLKKMNESITIPSNVTNDFVTHYDWGTINRQFTSNPALEGSIRVRIFAD